MMEQFASGWWKSLFSFHFFPFLLLLSCHSLLDLVASLPARGFTKSLAYLFRQQHAQALTSRNGPYGWRDLWGRDFMCQDVKFNTDSLKFEISNNSGKNPMLCCLWSVKFILCVAGLYLAWVRRHGRYQFHRRNRGFRFPHFCLMRCGKSGKKR